MGDEWKEMIWGQFGAAIQMLENAINACPDELWGNRSHQPEFWYLVYHTLFWLDFYNTDNPDEYVPPEPFNLSEHDPEGILPDRVYSKEEMLKFLEYGRMKTIQNINSLNKEKSPETYVFGTLKLKKYELIFYNMRHVQHHAAQLNLVLRQQTDSAPRWVRRTDIKLK